MYNLVQKLYTNLSANELTITECVINYYRIVMYLGQEMYDLLLCTHCPHEMTSFTGQSRT